MGILTDFIQKFKKQKSSTLKYSDRLSGSSPIYSQFGQNIYASDVVQQAISCIVMEMKKLSPQHIREVSSDPIPLDSDLQRLLNNPNEKMTQSEFLEKIFWQLFLNYNSFIVPTYETRTDNDGNIVKKYTGLYPIQPVRVDFLQDPSGELFIKFQFLNNYETTLRYSDVIHVRYRFSVNEFMGGNMFGQPDNDALIKTLELNEVLLQGVGKALKSSFAINGIIKYNTLMDDGKMDQAIAELEQHLKNNESGFLPLDIKGEFIPMQNKIQLVDSPTLKFIDEKILRNFGVPLAILTGDYTKIQYEAFYQKTLEPLIISIGQAFTKTLFTPREKAFGNKIVFYPHELIFMDTNQKLNLFNQLVDTASCYKNELRTAFGMKPLPELAGQLAISSNKNNALNNDGSVKEEPDQTNDEVQNDKSVEEEDDEATG